MKVGDILNKKIKARLDVGVDAFARALVGDENHPLITGITRGNWVPSVDKPTLSQLYYGFSQGDILDAMTSNTLLISIGEAENTATNFSWKLGDKLFWTNSLDHIIDLEIRRKFFDQIVHNATIEAQAAIKRGKR